MKNKPFLCLAPIADSVMFTRFLFNNFILIEKSFICVPFGLYINSMRKNKYTHLCFGIWNLGDKNLRFGITNNSKNINDNFNVIFFENWISAANYSKKKLYLEYEK